MVKLKLVPYRLRIKDLTNSKRGKPIYLDLKKCTFETYFQEFIKDYQAIQINSSQEKIFSCNSCTYSSDGIYFGMFGSGDFGYSAQFFNVDTKKPSGNRGVKDAQSIKFYYLLKVFSDEAYLLLNQFKRNGMKTDLQNYLKNYLQGKLNLEIEVIINPLVSSGLTKLKEVRKIRFIKRRFNRDIEGQIMKINDGKNQEELIEEKSFIIGGNRTFSTIAFLKGLWKNYKEKNYVEIDESQFSQVKIDAEMDDGSQKVLNLNNEFSYNEGIDQDFVGDFPQENKFYQEAKTYFLNVISGSRT